MLILSMVSIKIMEIEDRLTICLTTGFRCHPNHGNDLRRAYNWIMADINDGTLLKSMCRDVTKSDIDIRRLGRIERNVLIEANYLIA